MKSLMLDQCSFLFSTVQGGMQEKVFNGCNKRKKINKIEHREL